MRIAVLIAAALATTAPGQAQTVPPPAPAVEPATADPARLAEARLVIARLVPPGAYRTVMNSAMAPILGSMGDNLKTLPLRQIAEMSGLSATEAASLDKVNIEQVVAIYDPHWKERMQLSTRAMISAMGDFFTTEEPQLREAYARAYARRFTLPDLQALNAFFQSPAGSKFAGQYLTIASDPAITDEMRALMPKLMAQMPAFIAASTKATASLPPPRKMQDLSPAERASLAKAIGVPESQLRDPKPTK